MTAGAPLIEMNKIPKLTEKERQECIDAWQEVFDKNKASVMTVTGKKATDKLLDEMELAMRVIIACRGGRRRL